jgi:hypothetical protein
MGLFSYKMTHDSGFAPNPFGGVLTIATCKPQIRLYKNRGDWIAGFTSGTLNGDSVGQERLIYLMQVEDKLTFADYFCDPSYNYKIPRLPKSAGPDAGSQKRSCEPKRLTSARPAILMAGDNIYEPLPGGGFKQVPNRNHNERHKEHDLSGEFVLLSLKFVYFGSDAIVIPHEVRPSIPAGQSGHGSRTHDEDRARRFIEYVFSHSRSGVLAAPQDWPDGDFSWNET